MDTPDYIKTIEKNAAINKIRCQRIVRLNYKFNKTHAKTNTILIIEDQADYLFEISETFKKHGFQVDMEIDIENFIKKAEHIELNYRAIFSRQIHFESSDFAQIFSDKDIKTPVFILSETDEKIASSDAQFQTNRFFSLPAKTKSINAIFDFFTRSFA